MLMMTILLLSLLFIVSLFYTLSKFPTKNLIMAWFQSSQASTKVAPTDQKKVMKSTSTSTSSSTTHNKDVLKSIFATFDKNNDGFITKKELRESLKNIGMLMTEREVEEMVEKVDSNGDGLIDLDEFCEMFESALNRDDKEAVMSGEEGDGEAELKEAFDVFDGNGDGLITVEELGMVLSSLGLKEGKRLESCKEMIRNVDMDGDGMVNFDEFKRMLKSGGRLVPVS
uniref:Putative calmodulin-like protein 3 n=1 Tax=Davidia involucrata TaxID=16924 RepID=A0A5B7BIF3_DAVIN